MELVKPNGDIATNEKVDPEPTPSNGEGTPGESTPPETTAEKPQPHFAASFEKGVLTIRLNLIMAAASPEMGYVMEGFVMSELRKCLVSVDQMRQRAAQERELIKKATHDAKHRTFLSKILRK